MQKVLFDGFDRHLLVLPGQPEYDARARPPDCALALQAMWKFQRDTFNQSTMRRFLAETFGYTMRQMNDGLVVRTMAELLCRGRFQLVAVQREFPDLSAVAEPPPPPEKRPPARPDTAWIEVLLVDEEDRPMPGERYEITKPDGKAVSAGTLDSKGSARLTGLRPGQYSVVFPEQEQGYRVEVAPRAER